MRSVKDPQAAFGQADIGNIKFDLKSRDDIPQLLAGLQQIYITPELHEAVFEILKQVIPKRKGKGLTEQQCAQAASSDRGRPGMEQWKILVLGVLRLGLNTDNDRIHELANNHNTIRMMLGHSDGWSDETQYSLQSIKDNLSLFTPEILDQINQEVIKAGHILVKKKPNAGPIGITRDSATKAPSDGVEPLRGRCDSFVVETNVHFPTDINLLYDAVRKSIESSADLAEQYNLTGWRQYRYNIKQFKNQYRKLQNLKHSTSRSDRKKQQRADELELEYITYLQMGAELLEKTKQTLQQAQRHGAPIFETLQLEEYQGYVSLLLDQIHRRILFEEKIPHSEKIFSIFEPHTEWISKGKAGVPVELGLRVCIMEDHHQFILHHQVMAQQTDDKVAVEMVTETQKRFPHLAVASFDKGFHSPQNQSDLKEHLEHVVLPKKGRLSEADKEHEGSKVFKKYRNQHSAVESAINGLEHHGLDICPDHGIDGFKRYVALAVLSRNIKRLGTIVRRQEREKEQRKRGCYKKAA
jgi:transposase, IS5 family